MFLIIPFHKPTSSGIYYKRRALSKDSFFGNVCRHHHNGRWEARIGRVFGNKYLYLGTYSKSGLNLLFLALDECFSYIYQSQVE